MRPVQCIIGIVFMILLFPEKSYTQIKQDTLFLNLAEIGPGSTMTVQGNRSYSIIVVENTLYECIYNISIISEVKLLPPLILDRAKLDTSRSGTNCKNLIDKVNYLICYQSAVDNKSRTESELGAKVQELKGELKKNDCGDPIVRKEAKKWLGTTRIEYHEEVKVRTGEKVTITIERDNLVWTFVYLGKSPGKWVTTYGFGFTPKALEKDTYYANQEPDTSLFRIMKSNKPAWPDLNYVPAVFFSFFPSQNFSKGWKNSVTAGLGFDLSAPAVFFGYNGTFWHNIGLSCGLAFQQQYSLKSQFTEGQIISEYLDADQLHDKIYRPNFYLAITFRFGENPFLNNNTIIANE